MVTEIKSFSFTSVSTCKNFNSVEISAGEPVRVRELVDAFIRGFCVFEVSYSLKLNLFPVLEIVRDNASESISATLMPVNGFQKPLPTFTLGIKYCSAVGADAFIVRAASSTVTLPAVAVSFKVPSLFRA